jgi:hypothetical protein
LTGPLTFGVDVGTGVLQAILDGLLDVRTEAVADNADQNRSFANDRDLDRLLWSALVSQVRRDIQRLNGGFRVVPELLHLLRDPRELQVCPLPGLDFILG